MMAAGPFSVQPYQCNPLAALRTPSTTATTTTTTMARGFMRFLPRGPVLCAVPCPCVRSVGVDGDAAAVACPLHPRLLPALPMGCHVPVNVEQDQSRVAAGAGAARNRPMRPCLGGLLAALAVGGSLPPVAGAAA